MVSSRQLVAPYVGAWIETRLASYLGYGGFVAPYVGAWIETALTDAQTLDALSRTLRGCVD